jgi:hypothetical protein
MKPRKKTSVKKPQKLQSVKKIVTPTKEKEFFILESLGLLTNALQFHHRMQALTYSNDSLIKSVNELKGNLSLVTENQKWQDPIISEVRNVPSKMKTIEERLLTLETNSMKLG